MAKIALIEAQRITGLQEVYGGQIALSILSHHLKENAHEVKVYDVNDVGTIDLTFNGATVEYIVSKAKHFAPDYVGFTLMRDSIKDVAEMIANLRKHLPAQTKYIIGGSEATVNTKSALEKTKADFAVVGEGTTGLEDLIDGKLDAPGIAYLDDQKFVSHGRAPYMLDLWQMDVSTMAQNDFNNYVLVSTMGCPNRCAYCDNYKQWPKIEKRPLKNVVKDMQAYVESRLVERFFFYDDDFLLFPKRLLELDKMMEDSGLEQKISFLSRADSVLKALEVIDKVSGRISSIFMGIESFLPAQLKRMKKGVTAEQNHQALEELRKRGIQHRVNLIVLDKYSDLREVKQVSDVLVEHPEYLTIIRGTQLWHYQDNPFTYPDYMGIFNTILTALAMGRHMECAIGSYHSYMRGEKVLDKRKKEIKKRFDRIYTLMEGMATGRISKDQAIKVAGFRCADLFETLSDLYQNRSGKLIGRRFRTIISNIGNFYNRGGFREVYYQLRNLVDYAKDIPFI